MLAERRLASSRADAGLADALAGETTGGHGYRAGQVIRVMRRIILWHDDWAVHDVDRIAASRPL
jgi:hypothetical protein